jgi:hypothetical protein
MTIQRIPTLADGSAFYTQRTALDGVDYELEFDWSTLESRWYLTIYTVEHVLLAGPAKVICNRPLCAYWHGRAGMFQGEIWAVCSAPDKSPPGLDELGIGRRVELTYVPRST